MISSAQALGLAAALGLALFAGRRNANAATPTPSEYITDPARIRRVQEQLTALGYPTGWDPGVVNTPTLASVNQFLQDLGQPAVGGITARVEALVARVFELERQRLDTGSSSSGSSSSRSSSGVTFTPGGTPAGNVTMDPLGGRVVTDRATIANVQRWLQGLGYDPGAIDGYVGSNTLRALHAFLADEGLNNATPQQITDPIVRLVRDAYGSGHLASTPAAVSDAPADDARARRIASVLEQTARRARGRGHRRY